MRRPAPTWTLFAIAAALLARPARAQTPAGGWVGRRVVTAYGTVLRDGREPAGAMPARDVSQTGRDRPEFRVYKVEGVEGDRLRVVSEAGDARGWITAAEAIPIERGVDYYSARIAAEPSDAYHFVNRAAVRVATGDLAGALADDAEAIRLDPKCALAYHNRGYTWARKGDPDRALADFTRAILIDPEYPRAYNKRGYIWLQKGSYARAAADFSRAISLDPKFARAYHNRGNTMARQKDYDKAIADYTLALRLDPADLLAFVDRANVEHAEGEDARALADLTEAIRRKPDCHEALVARAWLLATNPSEKLRDGRQAVHDATRACTLTRGKEAYPLGTLAAAYAERGDFASAVKYQERALALYKTRDDVAQGRARLDLYKSGKPYREPLAPAPAPRDRQVPPPIGDPSSRPSHAGVPSPGGRGA